MEVSCLLSLQDSSVGILADPEDIQIDHDHDPLAPHMDKVQHTTEVVRELRQATSNESVQSYEQHFQGDKNFSMLLNIRHINRVPFTRLLRMGTRVCCYFNDIAG